jgi:hypothetical protein
MRKILFLIKLSRVFWICIHVSEANNRIVVVAKSKIRLSFSQVSDVNIFTGASKPVGPYNASPDHS